MLLLPKWISLSVNWIFWFRIQIEKSFVVDSSPLDLVFARSNLKRLQQVYRKKFSQQNTKCLIDLINYIIVIQRNITSSRGKVVISRIIIIFFLYVSHYRCITITLVIFLFYTLKFALINLRFVSFQSLHICVHWPQSRAYLSFVVFFYLLC